MLRAAVRGWLVSLHRSLSYSAGFARGRRGEPLKCPWWADKTVYILAHADGRTLYLQSDGYG
jgi:hypothetical protein